MLLKKGFLVISDFFVKLLFAFGFNRIIGDIKDAFAQEVFDLRAATKSVAENVKILSVAAKTRDDHDEEDKGEMIANTILAYRHLEDAAMRLGKVMQAKCGGKSVLSK